jgi:hypothetical protein
MFAGRVENQYLVGAFSSSDERGASNRARHHDRLSQAAGRGAQVADTVEEGELLNRR